MISQKKKMFHKEWSQNRKQKTDKSFPPFFVFYMFFKNTKKINKFKQKKEKNKLNNKRISDYFIRLIVNFNAKKIS